jgi:hypothetical protein
MLRIKKACNGLLITLANGGVYSEILLPVYVKKTYWREFSLILLGELGFHKNKGDVDLRCIERRTELSGCLDERAVFHFLKDNPELLEALISLYKAGEALKEERI